MIECPDCHKLFDYPCRLKQHKLRKTPCNLGVNDDVTREGQKKDTRRTREGQKRTKNVREGHEKDKEDKFDKIIHSDSVSPLNCHEGGSEKDTRRTLENKFDKTIHNDESHNTNYNIHESTIQTHNITSDNKYIICKYCEKECSKYKINRHYRNGCKLIPQEIKDRYISKYNKDRRHKRKTERTSGDNITDVSGMNFQESNNNNNVTTNDNSTNDNSTNNTINNNNITINAFGKEDISFFTKDKILEYLNMNHNSVPHIIDDIYNHDSNRNFYLDKKTKYMVTVSPDKTIKLEHISDAVDTIANKGEQAFCTFNEQYKDDIPKRKYNVNKIKETAINHGEYDDEHSKAALKTIYEQNNYNKDVVGAFKTTFDQKKMDRIRKLNFSL